MRCLFQDTCRLSHCRVLYTTRGGISGRLREMEVTLISSSICQWLVKCGHIVHIVYSEGYMLYSSVKFNYRDYILWCTRLLPEDIHRTIFPTLDFPTLNFGVKAVMKTSVLLTWDLPPNYKPQVPFKVSRHPRPQVQGQINVTWN